MKHRSATAALTAAGIIASVALGALTAPAASAADTTTTGSSQQVASDSLYADSFARQVLNLMNTERAKVGSGPLKWNQDISQVSQDWANHLGVATLSPAFDWSTIHRTDAGGNEIPPGSYWYREIIGFNFTPQDIVNWWMNSPAHKAAMLDPNATDAGIGYVVPTSGPYAGFHLLVSNLAGYGGVRTIVPFTDIAGSGFQTDILWMANTGVATGYNDATFQPYAPVSRDAMAAFMYRLAGSPAYTPPAVSPFSDVPTSNMYYRQITWLASTGIATGYGDGTFRPYDTVSRDAMAAFMYRFAAKLSRVPSATSFAAPSVAVFTDSAPGTQFYKEISWMRTAAISTGFSDGSFGSGLPVTREAMSAFMHRLNTYLANNGAAHL